MSLMSLLHKPQGRRQDFSEVGADARREMPTPLRLGGLAAAGGSPGQ